MAAPSLSEFEALVLANLSSDNHVRSSAESSLLSFKASAPATFLMSLLHLLAAGPTAVQPQAREFAAVILRQNLLVHSSNSVWKDVDLATRQQIQAGLLHLYRTESVVSLRKKITDAVAATATRIKVDHTPAAQNQKDDNTTSSPLSLQKEIPASEQTEWPELMPTVMSLAEANLPETRQSLLHLIDKLAEFNPGVLRPHLAACKMIIVGGLKDKGSMEVRLSALRACISLLLSLPESDRASLSDAVPLMFEVLGSAFNEADELTIVQAVTVLNDLVTVSPKFLKNHLKPILGAMVHMVACQQLEGETRRVCLTFLLTLAEEGKGMIRKMGDFATQVIPLAFSMVQELQHTESWDQPLADDENEGDEDDGFENYKFGCEAIGRLSTALGGKIFLPLISPLIDRALHDQQHWNVRHAGLISIAHMASGADKHLEPRLKNIMNQYVVPLALNDPHHRVRWAAVDVCAYLCDAFEPMFANVYTEQIFQVLMTAMQAGNHWRLIAHACLCFPDFCRGLEKEKLMPYMEPFLKQLVTCLSMTQFPKVVENALSAVSSVAAVAEEDFIPYYDSFMPGVKGILMTMTDEKQKNVRGKAIECLGMLAQAVGADKFRTDMHPITDALLTMLVHGNLSSDDPQHGHIVTTLARFCRAMGKEFAPFLPRILPDLIRSARIEDACVIVSEGEVNPYEGKAGYKTSVVDVRQAGTQQISLNTSLLEEKARAIRMLFEYANTMGGEFFPYVEEVASILIPSVRYQFNTVVRTNAIMSLPPLMRCVREALENDVARRDTLLLKLFNFMWNYVIEGIKVEYDLEFLCDLLDAFADVIAELPTKSLTPPQIDELNDLIRRLVIECLERCKARDDASHEEDFDEAEAELMEMENKQEDEFLGFVYQLVNQLVKQQPTIYPASFNERLYPVFQAMMRSDDVSLRTSALCVIAQIMEDCPQDAISKSYLGELHNVCMESAEADDVGLRQSAVFGLGVCAMVAGTEYAKEAPTVMQLLAKVVQEGVEAAKQAAEDEEEDYDEIDPALATDNAISALAKIFIYTYGNGTANCPPAVVTLMSSWVHFLPVGADLIEARKVHDMLATFVAQNNPIILGENMRNLPVILGVFAMILARDDWQEVCAPETKQKIGAIFQQLQQSLPQQQMQALMAAMNEEQREVFRPFMANGSA